MATGSSSPSSSKSDAVSSDHQPASSQPPESLTARRRPKNRAPSQPHEYTSLHDLLKFPCTCPFCTYLRQRDALLPIPEPRRRFRSKALLPRAPAVACLQFLNRRVAASISRAIERLIRAVQAAEDEEDASLCGASSSVRDVLNAGKRL
ncbi:hypothetical protein NL676_031272 [Syzygium grande]|nr:hypothetical protein NL676_031272 [Syzygium grande]